MPNYIRISYVVLALSQKECAARRANGQLRNKLIFVGSTNNFIWSYKIFDYRCKLTQVQTKYSCDNLHADCHLIAIWDLVRTKETISYAQANKRTYKSDLLSLQTLALHSTWLNAKGWRGPKDFVV